MSEVHVESKEYRDTSKNKIDRQIDKQGGASEYAREELKRMHRELTDDDLIEENKRKAEIEENLQDRMADTAYFL